MMSCGSALINPAPPVGWTTKMSAASESTTLKPDFSDVVLSLTTSPYRVFSPAGTTRFHTPSFADPLVPSSRWTVPPEV